MASRKNPPSLTPDGRGQGRGMRASGWDLHVALLTLCSVASEQLSSLQMGGQEKIGERSKFWKILVFSFVQMLHWGLHLW